MVFGIWGARERLRLISGKAKLLHDRAGKLSGASFRGLRTPVRREVGRWSPIRE